ncbi:MAG: hypothetical protein ACFCGT_20470 [Sandaracinaceae bacterium]
MRRRQLPFLPSVLLLVACGPSGLPAGATTPTLSLGGAAERRIETLTDLEDVRDVAVLDGVVFLATDLGLLRYGVPDEPGELVAGLPSPDVRALAEEQGALWIATAGGLARYHQGGVTRVDDVPDVGPIQGLQEIPTSGTLYLCGLGGLVRKLRGGRWEAFGDPVACTSMAVTPQGHLWVGTTEGLLYIEQGVVREHPVGGGLPEAYVRSVVALGDDEALALVQGPSGSVLARYRNDQWYGYTLEGLREPVLTLVRRGDDRVMLAAQSRIFAVAAEGEGLPLLGVHKERANVRSYRAGLTPAAEHRPADAPAPSVLKDPQPFLVLEEGEAQVPAPPLRLTPVDVDLHGRLYHAFNHGGEVFLAVSNGGVIHLTGEGEQRTYLTRTLVPEGNLQIATDARGGVWVLSRDRHLTSFRNDRLVRVDLPSGLVAQALASGPQGAYLAAIEGGEGSRIVRIFVNSGSAWRPLVRRELAEVDNLVGIPFMGVAPNRTIWLGLRVVHEDGVSAPRMRGVAVVDVDREEVLYHHRGADREEGIPMPDEVSEITFDTDYAWLSSLTGVVRVGNDQAVRYGEARGVRGELVTDIAVGDQVLWIASGEGLGKYDRNRFSYGQPGFIQSARPTQLAVDLAGHLWGASETGLILHEGEEWLILGSEQGLPNPLLSDVEVDGAGRVWLLAEDRLMVLEDG